MKQENKICLKWILELVYFCTFVSEDHIEFEQFELNNVKLDQLRFELMS